MRVKAFRALIVLVVLAAIAYLVWQVFVRTPARPRLLTVYYTKMDGTSLGTWTISQRQRQAGESMAQYRSYEALYAAVQNVAGPPSDVPAVRFPAGTHVDGVTLDGAIADVDLSSQVTQQSGTFGENGQFKALVYTETAVPGIAAVQVTVGGRRLQTLPHGNLELDAPLRRSDW